MGTSIGENNHTQEQGEANQDFIETSSACFFSMLAAVPAWCALEGDENPLNRPAARTHSPYFSYEHTDLQQEVVALLATSSHLWLDRSDLRW